MLLRQSLYDPRQAGLQVRCTLNNFIASADAHRRIHKDARDDLGARTLSTLVISRCARTAAG